MPKPRQGKEVKKHRSIRLEDHVFQELKRRHGDKLQNWIDQKVAEENIPRPPDETPSTKN